MAVLCSRCPVPCHANNHLREWKPSALGHRRLRLTLDGILLQESPTAGNHQWQIALIKGKRESVGLRKVVRGEVNDHRDVPTPLSRQCHGEFRLHTWQGGFTLKRGMHSFNTSQKMGYFRQVNEGTTDPDTGPWRTTMHGHLEPVAIPVVVRHWKLPTVHPES